MPLDAPQTEWLNKAANTSLPIPGGKPGSDPSPTDPAVLKEKLRLKHLEEDLADEQLKQMKLLDAVRQIKPLKPGLREAFDIQITKESGKTEDFQAKDGDQRKSGESRQIRGGDTLGGGKGGQGGAEAVKGAHEAYAMITRIRLDLEKEKTSRSIIDMKTGVISAGPQQALFTTAEITDELFTPLVREKIVPDTFITGNFSKTQKMLDATNALYKEDLKDKKNKVSSGKSDLLKSMMDVGNEMADSLIGALAGSNAKMAKNIADGTTALMKLSVDVGQKVVDGIQPNDVTGFINQIPAMLGSLVGAATGSTDIGQLVQASGGIAASAAQTIINGIQNKKLSPEDLLGLISSIINLTMTKVGQDSKTQKEQDRDKLINDALTKALSAMSTSNALEFTTQALAGDWAKAKKAGMKVLLDFAKSIPTIAGDAYTLDKGTDAPPKDTDPNATQSSKKQAETQLKTSGKQILKTAMDGKKSLDELSEQLEKEADAEVKEQKDKESVDVALQVQKDIEKEKQEFLAELQNLNNPSTDGKTVMKLIQQITRDRAIISVAVAIGTGGIEVASKFFAPLAVGTEIIKMAANIAAAVQRAADLRAFVDEQEGAANAVSPYMSSIQNFVGNQENQLTHYAIAAALNGVKIAASVAATAFPMAAPIVTAVSAVQTAAEGLYQFHHQSELKASWEITLAAFADPQDRKLGLQARRQNPTLAKYSIAYGALEEKDPVAVHMANACGLDNETLKNKDTNVGRVKQYLEVRFPDDGTVVGYYEDAKGWQGKLPKAALVPGTVFNTYAVITSELKSTPGYLEVFGSTKAVPPDALIALIRFAQKPLAETDKEDPTKLEERIDLLSRLVDDLGGEGNRLRPISGDIPGVFAKFGELAEASADELTMALVKAKLEAAKKQHEEAQKKQQQPQTGGGQQGSGPKIGTNRTRTKK